MRVSLNIIATGKYVEFLSPIIESSLKHFFLDDDVLFIIHTDDENLVLPENAIINKIKHEPWPNPTLKRFHYFLMTEEEILNTDICFYVDVDSLFINDVKFNISDVNGIIPTLHPGFYGTVGTPERNPASEAYLAAESQNMYFCGGFFGGDSSSFIEMSKIIKSNIDCDLGNGIIAVWHDESHLNHYLFHNKPKRILGNNFAISQDQMQHNPNSKIVFLDKDKNIFIKR